MKMSSAAKIALEDMIEYCYAPRDLFEEFCGDGICFVCGELQGDCEPDAIDYTCESCGHDAVYGLEVAVMQYIG